MWLYPLICVSVLRSKDYLCGPEESKPELPSVGYISNAHTALECGGHNRPYKIHLPHGQTLNLTLIDFHLPLHVDPTLPSSALRCDVYATIREPSSGRTQDVCGGQARETVIFVTTSNIIEIYMNDKMADGSRYFLLKYHSKLKNILSLQLFNYLKQNTPINLKSNSIKLIDLSTFSAKGKLWLFDIESRESFS